MEQNENTGKATRSLRFSPASNVCAEYAPSLTLLVPFRSQFLFVSLRGSRSFLHRVQFQVLQLLLFHFRFVPQASAGFSRAFVRHLHALRVTYTDKMAYTLFVVQIAGNCSPRRGLSSSANETRNEREKGWPKWRACETANFMIYKRDPL